MLIEIATLSLCFSVVALSLMSSRNLSGILRELERHARGREIRRRLAEQESKGV